MSHEHPDTIGPVAESLLELLDQGADGWPRRVVLDASDAREAARLGALVEREATRRGYVPLAVRAYARLDGAGRHELRHRALVLIHHGARGGGESEGARALVEASAGCPRPHVLVTIGGGSGAGVLREPRPAFAIESEHVSRSADRRRLPQATAALALAARGRHAAAERLLREAAGARERRADLRGAASLHVELGRLLLDRGQPGRAERCFDTASALFERSRDSGSGLEARVWMAIARVHGARLTDAEALLRAVLVALAGGDPDIRMWTQAVLADLLLAAGRTHEAVVTVPPRAPELQDAECTVRVLAVATRVHAAAGAMFEAGRAARGALDAAAGAADPRVRVQAECAHLLVLAAAGDLHLAEQCVASVLRISREQHLTLPAIEARLIWTRALIEAGRSAEARRELRRLQRLARALPPLVRREVESVSLTPTVVRPPTAGAPLIVPLLEASHADDDDETSLERMLDLTGARLRTSRIDVQTIFTGVVSTRASAGSGVAPHLGTRCAEAGFAIGPERVGAAWELAVPVRFGSRHIGVVAARWPMDREPSSDALPTLEILGALAAPRLDVLLARRVEAARAATAVPELVGVSPAIEDVRRAIARAAAAPFPVLVEGESGVGKELIARAIHALSPRRERRFCDVNCAAIPEELLESELFGHARGAFTGALTERAGLFEEATGGTLFLDELPDLSPRAQAKLLRVLQQGEVRRVGESFTRTIDVRVVAATNRPMRDEVRAGRFRQDLLYRVDVIRITVPPLRERPDDIPILVEQFWRAAASRAGSRATLAPSVVGALGRYHWPGNVRELQNVMAALAVAAPARGLVRPSALPGAITGATVMSTQRLADARREFDRRFIEVALARAGGCRARAAAQLGVSRQGLLKLMTRLDVAVASCNGVGEREE